MSQPMIFDIGMYDGADTAYYLELGFRVVAVEANPALVALAQRRFANEIEAGALSVVHNAITLTGEPATLTLSAEDLGSSSTQAEAGWHASNHATGSITVPGCTIEALFHEYGIPHCLKVDIEGADHLCIRALRADRRPAFLSFEMGDDADALLSHSAAIGYRRFRVVHQRSFRELSRLQLWSDRLKRRVMRRMGYDAPRRIRRAGRFFVSGHSSGPVPWLADGPWRSLTALQQQIHEARRDGRFVRGSWHDIQAAE